MNYNKFLKSKEWNKTKDFLKLVSEKECYICGSVNNLQVHHLRYATLNYEDKYDLIYLCSHHHFLYHFPNKLEKRNLDKKEEILKGLKWLDGKMHSIRMKNGLKIISYKNNIPLLLYNRLTKKELKKLPKWLINRNKRLERKLLKKQKKKDKRESYLKIGRDNLKVYIQKEKIYNTEYLPEINNL